MKRKDKYPALTLNRLISKLRKIKAKHGGRMRVCFDSEAAEFLTSYVGIDDVWYLSKDWIGTEMVSLSTGEPSRHICQWKIDNIKLNFATMAKMGKCKSQWQLEMFYLPVQNSRLPQTHKSDKAFFKRYWKLDKTPYEKFMKSYFPGWLKK